MVSDLSPDISRAGCVSLPHLKRVGSGTFQCWSQCPATGDLSSHARQEDRVHPYVMEVVASCAVKVVRRLSSVCLPPPEEGRTPQSLLQRSFLSSYLLCLGPVSTLRLCSGESPAWGPLSLPLVTAEAYRAGEGATELPRVWHAAWLGY